MPIVVMVDGIASRDMGRAPHVDNSLRDSISRGAGARPGHPINGHPRVDPGRAENEP